MSMLLAYLLTGCGPTKHDPLSGTPPGGDEPEVVVDATAGAYAPDHVIDVQIDMAAADWAALSTQTRDGYELLSGDCQAQPFENPFTPFSATVTLDGAPFAPVSVRKKGFLGSMSSVKPSLKIDLAEYDGSQRWSGVDHLTLNNAISDPSYVRQCLGFGLFAAAGVPAPRCSFARVTVNGEYLGVYANVEPVGTPFLQAHFSSDAGNLYEGTLSDFREGWTGTFEKKTNEEVDDWSDIQAVVDALEANDEDLVTALDPLVDIDAFLTFWATEVLITHVDGYAWNTNNFLLYADPSDGRFRFIPWGIDSVFLPEEQIAGIPASVYAYGELARRLYALPELRARYLDRLRSLLDDAWDEDRLVAEASRMESLVAAELPPNERATAATAADGVRGMIRAQRARIVDEIAGGGLEWPYPSRVSFCFTELGTAEASFDTTWGTLTSADAFTTGVATLDLVWQGAPLTTVQVGSVAGDQEGQAVLYVAAWLDATQAVVLYASAPESEVRPGVVPVAFGAAGLYYIDTATMADFTFLAYVVGEMTLESADMTEGGAVIGSLDGGLWSWGQ